MKRRGMGARRPLQGIGALVLTLCSGAAMALGLGDIRVLSRPGQPLVAEIPVISNEPGELENAHVALASPATFARVGLEPPQGLVNELQFQFTQDAGGRAVIRVTSASPVSQKALSFLIEVDWGQGRLVREYSALLDAPNTAAAIAEPMIEAPAASAENRIIRETEALPPEPLPPTPTPEAAPPVAATPEAAPAPRPARPAPAAPTLQPGDSLTVRSGQTLSGIAAQLAGDGASLDQTMVALLRANPDAFIGGNINRLKAGAVLRTPAQEELARVGAAEARAMVREQAAQWRQARAAIPQPAEAGAASTPTASSPAPSAAAPAAEGARLEIAPAVASDAKNAGTTSGTSAGGEGDMAANEQLQQAREDIATRDAEIQELRNRVGELEKLKQDQQKLIAMKDTDLAAAQARLAKAGPAPGSESGTPMWLWGGLALVIAGIAAWLASRRRKPSPLPPLPRQGFDTATLAAAVPAAPSMGEREVDREVELEEVDLREEEHAPWRAPVEEAPAPVIVAEPAAPAWHADAVAPLNPVPAGRDRLELAVAYLDLGDTETARSLLLEVAQGPDPAARAEAVALLGQLR